MRKTGKGAGQGDKKKGALYQAEGRSVETRKEEGKGGRKQVKRGAEAL